MQQLPRTQLLCSCVFRYKLQNCSLNHAIFFYECKVRVICDRIIIYQDALRNVTHAMNKTYIR